jgi:hypothetical protein
MNTDQVLATPINQVHVLANFQNHIEECFWGWVGAKYMYHLISFTKRQKFQGKKN